MKKRMVVVTFKDGSCERYKSEDNPFEINISDKKWRDAVSVEFFMNSIPVGTVYLN